MKKILVLIFVLLSMGCSNAIKKEKKPEPVKEPEKKVVTPKYVDNNLMKINFYRREGNVIKKVTEHNSVFVAKKDILNYQVYATDLDFFAFVNTFKDTWLPYWSSYENYEQYKIGYLLEYKLINGTKIKHIITNPENTQKHYDYIEIYLYDALAHSSDSFYSHVTTEDYKDTTIFTSIKVTAGSKIAEVVSPLKLTAFSYDSDDFTSIGDYRGQAKSTIIINNQ